MKLTNKTTTNQRQVVHKIWNGTMVNLEKGKEMKEFQGDFQSTLMCLRVFPYLFLLRVTITLNHLLSCILTQLVIIIYLFLLCFCRVKKSEYAGQSIRDSYKRISPEEGKICGKIRCINVVYGYYILYFMK